MTPSTSSDRLPTASQVFALTAVRRGQVFTDRGGWWYGELGAAWSPQRGRRLLARGWVLYGQPCYDGTMRVYLTTAGILALEDWEAKHGDR